MMKSLYHLLPLLRLPRSHRRCREWMPWVCEEKQPPWGHYLELMARYTVSSTNDENTKHPVPNLSCPLVFVTVRYVVCRGHIIADMPLDHHRHR